MKQRMIELYGEGILRRSALRIRGGDRVLEEILGGGAFRTALEIGTYRGCTAAQMAQFCERVITIDLRHGRLEQLGESFDRHAFWRSLGVDNVTLHLVADDREKADLIQGLDFDFAFVDGAHDETIANDFALVRRCGHVLFHDYDDRGQPCLNYVYDFVNSLPKHEVRIVDIFAYWTAR